MKFEMMKVNNTYIRDIMKSNLYKIYLNTKISSIKDIFLSNKESKILVVDNFEGEEIPITFISAEDILFMDHMEVSLNSYLNKNTNRIKYTFNKNDKIERSYDIISNFNCNIIPVKDEKSIIGFVTQNQIYKVLNEDCNNCKDIFSLILDRINNAICLVDKNCKVRYWNATAEKLYDIKKIDIIGKQITSIFPNALLPKVIEENKIYNNVYNSPRVDNNDIISASPIYKNSEIIGAISSDMEVSELIKISGILSKSKLSIENLEKEIIRNYDDINFSNIVGEDIKFKESVNFAKSISKAKINVMITGESGTGKELFAKAIHKESGRKGRFVAINCSAIPSNLMESELFGYESGAFTGALKKGKIGKFELAHEGTIFLDEIGDMPMYMQPKILRFLEDEIIMRVGSEKSKKVNVRVVAATNQDLKNLIDQKLFRKDLYYRLNPILIKLPSLRERKSDIPILVNNFVKSFCMKHRINIVRIPDEIMNILLCHDWEGNIRELKNVVERVVILSKDKVVNMEVLPDAIRDNNLNKVNKQNNNNLNLNNIISIAEKKAISEALEISKGNKAKAAKLLDIPRSTLYFKLDRYEINV